MSLFDPWELVDAAQEHGDAVYVEDVPPGDVVLQTRRKAVDTDRFAEGRPWCLVGTSILEVMAQSHNAHPDANYLAEERSLEVVLTRVDGMVLRDYGTDDHVVILDPSAVTLNHDFLDPERVVVLEVEDA